MSKKFTVGLPILILVLAVGIAAAMINLKPSANRKGHQKKIATIDVVVAKPEPIRARIPSTGTVGSTQQITMIPEVTGKVSYQSPEMVPGRLVKKGQTLLRIDPRDYKLAISKQQSQVRQAELDLQLEMSRQKVAKKEWELLGESGDDQDSQLALRKPQLQTAKENLEAAKSGLAQAELSLSRTTLRAPFNAMVLNESVDIGQVVSQNTSVATLVGTDRFWIQASVPVERLGLLEIPDFNGTDGSKVEIVHDLGGGQTIQREGTVVGLSGGLDPQTRTATLLIAVEDPMSINSDKPPLLHGAYVNLTILGREVSQAFSLPSTSLTEGDILWTVSDENKLVPKKVSVLWSDEEQIIVTDGLKEGDKVMITTLTMPIKGMEVQIKGSKKADEDSGESDTKISDASQGAE